MASHWFSRNGAGSSKKPQMDLTLKLSLPDGSNQSDDSDSNVETNTNLNNDSNTTNMFTPLTINPVPQNHFSRLNFNNAPYQGATGYRPVGGYGMAGQPMNPGFANNFPMNNEGRINYGYNPLYDMGNYQYPPNMMNPMGAGTGNQFNMMNNGGSMMPANFNPRGCCGSGTISFPSPPTPNEYTLIDTPARRNRNVEIHGPSDGSTVRGISRQRTGTYNEPNKRCTNFNCGTTETPMWRRGPLGPKTLCNACGIKYRKEEEKKKAKEAAKSSG